MLWVMLVLLLWLGQEICRCLVRRSLRRLRRLGKREVSFKLLKFHA